MVMARHTMEFSKSFAVSIILLYLENNSLKANRR
jgi:hypothetical protein